MIRLINRLPSSVPSSLLADYAERRVDFALRRFAHLVRRVTLRLTDDNGPRHGVDVRCVMTVELAHGSPLFVETRSAWPTSAISDAARRAREMVRRRRGRARARGGPP